MSKESEFRSLTPDEITILKTGNCTCSNWDEYMVKESFDPERCRNVHFPGKIRLGLFSGNFVDGSGVTIDFGNN